jgi:hypothetical protein
VVTAEPHERQKRAPGTKAAPHCPQATDVDGRMVYGVKAGVAKVTPFSSRHATGADPATCRTSKL